MGLPQCRHRMVAIENASLSAAIVPRSRLFGKTYRLSSQAMPAAVRSPPRGRSGCQGSTETPCRSPCPDRTLGSPPYSAGHSAGLSSGSCSPCLPGRSTCSPAGAWVCGKRCTPSCRETRENRTCCLHGKTDPSGRWHIERTDRSENTRRSPANRSAGNFLLCRGDNLLG